MSSYYGRSADNISNVIKLDNITFNGGTTYALTQNGVAFVPNNSSSILISIDGVVQQNNFTVNSSNIVFNFSPTSSNTCNWILHIGVGVAYVPAASSITKDKTDFVSTSGSAGLEIKGDGTTDGTLQLSCSQGSHGIKLKSPAHSTSSSYTLTFPGTDPAAGKMIQTDGSGNLSFVDAPSGGLQFIAAQNTSVTSLITFSNCFSSTYKNYAIFFTNINFSSDSNLGFRFGASGTYLDDYKGAAHGYDGGQQGTGYNSGVSYAQPTGGLFGVDTAANSQQGLTGSGIIYMPYDSTSAVYGTFQVGSRNDGNSQWTVANSWFTSNTDASYTDLRAYSTSSNDFNTHGRIAIYGIVDS